MAGVLNCFLIDDDPDDREIFCMALEEMEKKVACTFEKNGVEAIKKLQDHLFIPDFIFIDMNMPRMNGNDCLKELKKIPHLKNIPVYMYSTSADPESVAKTKELGAAGFIVKPTSVSELTQTLILLLGIK